MADFKTTSEKIKQRGYWRIEFYPFTYVDQAISSLSECKSAITASSVELRGWDYPHVPIQNDDKQEIYPKDGNRYESWIDWSIYKEVWRFYKSGKFIHLRDLSEHWYDEYEVLLASNPLPKLAPHTVVDVINVIYTLTEAYVFIYNLSSHMQEIPGFELRVSLNNVEGSKLVVLDPMRAGLHGSLLTHTTDISATKITLHKSDLIDKEQMLKLAREAMQTVFENFEWHASESLLEEEQKKLLSRRF